MKKHIRILCLVALLSLLAVPVVGAQQNLPGNGVCVVYDTPPEEDTFRVALIFTDFTDELSLPVMPPITLNCGSNPTDVQLMDVSPSLALNAAPPIPTNEPGLAEAQTGYAIVNTGAANLRTGPGPVFTRVAVVRGGTRLVVLGHNPQETWWYVQAGDIRGWIWEELLILRGDLTNVPVVITEAEVTPPSLYVGFVGNPIYDELSAAGRAICSIEGGREFPLLGRSVNSDWYYIEATCLDGTVVEGWLNAESGLVRNSGNVAIPIRR